VNAEGKPEEEPNFDDGDLDELYDTALQKFASEVVEEPKPKNAKDDDEGYRKAFRTYVVLVWMFCNAALVAVVLNAGGLARLEVGTTPGTEDQSAKVKTYLLIVLWSVAGLSAFKFIGAMWYKVHRIVSIGPTYFHGRLLTCRVVQEVDALRTGTFGIGLPLRITVNVHLQNQQMEFDKARM
jgi:hypothetical protein